MYPADTNYAQETVESPLWHAAFNRDISQLITYDVFGDVYVGLNDFIVLGEATVPPVTGVTIKGPFPGPGNFDN